MNTKKVKRHKSARSRLDSKTENGDAEIFVLPPNLLQQLGINLGNVELAQDCQTDVMPNDANNSAHTAYSPVISLDKDGITPIRDNSNDSGRSSEAGNETSMLDTANLMMKSIFLSPTFIQTASNVISNELEISNVEIDQPSNIPMSSMAVIEQYKKEQGHTNSDKIDTTDYYDMQDNKRQDHELQSSITNPSMIVTTNGKNITDVLDSTKTYSSDCSTISNSEPFGSTNTFICIPESHTESSNKINILSEEILSPSQLKELKSLHTSKISGLLPVTITAMIPGKTQNDILLGQIADDNSFPNNTTLPLYESYGIPEKVMATEFIKIFDEEGNVIQSSNINSNGEMSVHNVLVHSDLQEKEFKDLQVDNFNEDISLISNEEVCSNNCRESEEQNSNNSFIACLDIVVTDIENHFEQNEESLEQFVNEITSNDANDLVHKIENNVNDSANASDYDSSNTSTNCILKVETISDYHNDHDDKPISTCNGDIVFMNAVDTVDTVTNGDIILTSQSNRLTMLNENITKGIENEPAVDTPIETKVCDEIKQRTYANTTSTIRIPESDINRIINGDTKEDNYAIAQGDKVFLSKASVSEHCDKNNVTEFSSLPDTTAVNNINEKVKEIAKYLSLCKPIYTKTEKQAFRCYNNEKTLCTNKKRSYVLNSKLCIQGVEKPGGMEKNDHTNIRPAVIKTYGRKNRAKHSIISTLVTVSDPKNERLCNKSENLKEEINCAAPSSFSVTEEFCLCGDFGRLAYYDCDKLYEHIHFWEHKIINCTLGEVMSIYAKSNATYSNDHVNIPHIDTEDNKSNISGQHICWNNIEQNNVDILHEREKTDVNVAEISISETRESVRNTTEMSQQIVTVAKLHDIEEDPVQQTMPMATDPDVSNKGNTTDVGYRELDSVCGETEKVAAPKRTDAKINIIKVNLDNNLKEQSPILQYERKKRAIDLIHDETISDKQGSTICDHNVYGENARKKRKKSQSVELIDNQDINQEIELGNHKESEKYTIEMKPYTEKTRKKSSTKEQKCEPQCKKSVKCGVCEQLLTELEWKDHVSKVHCFVAWKTGDSFDFENPKLHRNLQERLDSKCSLKCSFCKIELNNVKKYLKNVQKCLKIKGVSVKISKKSEITTQDVIMSTPELKLKSSKCGVCGRTIDVKNWIDHIAKEHNYLAWKDGESVLDFKHEEMVHKYLTDLAKQIGRLTCSKCGVTRKYGKSYLQHVNQCNRNENIFDDSANNIDVTVTDMSSTLSDKTSTCGVCTRVTEDINWMEHIAKEHGYLAWKDGEPPLDLTDSDAIHRHLSTILKKYCVLTCSICGLKLKYVKSYMRHIKNCNTVQRKDFTDDSLDNSCMSENVTLDISSIDTTGDNKLMVHQTTCRDNKQMLDNSTQEGEFKIENVPSTSEDTFLKCGVCSHQIERSNWMQHIATEHDYLAWKDGEPALNLTDEEAMRQHLYNISKQNGSLKCSKCGLNRKYVKSYLQHKKSCTGTGLDSQDLSKNNDSCMSKIKVEQDTTEDDEQLIKCGVCKEEVKRKVWIVHIQKAHDYLAWKDGDTLDLNNAEEVQRHLYLICKENDGLVCSKCGVTRKYVKKYQQHIETCTFSHDYKCDINIALTDEESFTCGVCFKKGHINDWTDHRMEKHYNVAWAVGEIPINGNNPYVIEKCIKEYKELYTKLICNICGISRASCMGFYAHILVCGKTDEETEIFKDTCDVCNKKYLRIYHQQHMAAHKEQQNAKERRLREAEAKVKVEEVKVESTSSGRRKAAEKAITVIEKYKSGNSDHKCLKCDFGAESAVELEWHKCGKATSYYSDSDASARPNSESDEGPESDFDSDLSDFEENSTRKRHKDSHPLWSKVQRMPFSVKIPNEYLLKTGREFCNYHFTDDVLFPDWRTGEYQAVAEELVHKYMPPLTESCNVKICDESWHTYKRFEGKKRFGFSIFAGASIECMSWVSPRADEADPCHYMAVAGHSGVDAPRYGTHETPRHEGLIQIWDFGYFKELPKFVLGLAHDYGTMWAMCWCPSGARDLPGATDATLPRLGLLAVATSSGFVHIFAVPYPSAVTQNENLFYKLKPVAELRLSMGTDRTVYQATAVTWSPQKGHNFVVVGYADGTTAYFDLNIDSPLLKTIENNVTILYPYYDERPHTSCVTDVDTYPGVVCGAGASGPGAVCSGAPTGACAVTRTATRPVRVRAQFTTATAKFEPHWPASLLAADDAIGVAPNELELWGPGRRMGGVRAWCGCVRCARVALSTPPLLRIARPHHAYCELTKLTIGTLKMSLIGRKRKKLADDGLGTVLEPLTYEDAVKKYGVELTLRKDIKISDVKLREQFPERFPLADVAAMAFCPSDAHHSRLAVAAHCGIVFVLTL